MISVKKSKEVIISKPEMIVKRETHQFRLILTRLETRRAWKFQIRNLGNTISYIQTEMISLMEQVRHIYKSQGEFAFQKLDDQAGLELGITPLSRTCF